MAGTWSRRAACTRTGSGIGAPEPWPQTLDAVPVHVTGMAARGRAAADRPACTGWPRPRRSSNERGPSVLATAPGESGDGSNAATFIAAGHLRRGFGLDVAYVVLLDLLWAWAGHREGWSRGWLATKLANAERFGTQAWGGLL